MTRKHLARCGSNESGVAMALVLATIFLIVLISSTLVALAMNEYQLAGGAERSRQAFQIAEAAIEKGVFEVRRDPAWDDSGLTAGATRSVPAVGAWYPLWDGAADVTDQDFPASSTLGLITVELCRYDGSTFCPGVPNPVVAGCTASTCIWMRATGRVTASSRQIEVLLGKINPGTELINFSNGAINIGAGGGGNGTFRLHGTLYVASCVDPDGAGPQPCVGLTMQGSGAILNDIPFPTTGDPDTTAPYNNRVFVNGVITGQGNSWQIGLDNQPMRGVHATGGWASAYDNQIDALQKDTAVPVIPFPDPSRACDPADPRTCLINRVYHPISPLPVANASTAYVCTTSGGCTAAQWRAVNLSASNDIVPFCASLCSNPWGGGNIQTRVVIPDAGSAISCTSNSSQAATCNAAGRNSVDGPGNFSLVFNGFGPLPGAPAGSPLNLAIQRSTAAQDIFIHSREPFRFEGDVYYTGFATFLIENASDATASRPAMEIRGAMTPMCRASQGAACTQTFGAPRDSGGETLAFAVGPACTPFPPFVPGCVAPAGGGIYARGSNIELNLVLMAHGTLKNDNPQNWYGLFIAGLLDWDNNPSIFPVTGLRAHLPPGLDGFTNSASGLVVFRWREVL